MNNSEHLQVIASLENAHRAATPEVRRAAAQSIRELVIRNEELAAKLENREEPSWLEETREGLLPRVRAHLETKSGKWPQVLNEVVHFGSSAQLPETLFQEAFARVKANKYPQAKIQQWRLLEAVIFDPFTEESVSTGLHPCGS